MATISQFAHSVCEGGVWKRENGGEIMFVYAIRCSCNMRATKLREKNRTIKYQMWHQSNTDRSVEVSQTFAFVLQLADALELELSSVEDQLLGDDRVSICSVIARNSLYSE